MNPRVCTEVRVPLVCSMPAACWSSAHVIRPHIKPCVADSFALIFAFQYAYRGTGMDLPLLQWLETHTFPVEARFKDTSFARKVRLDNFD